MSLMASSSSLPSRNWSYNVFVSFHGPDVRKTLLSHLREQFKRNGITMFDDQEIERSATIAPSLTQAIRESRVSIVILSKKYASSSWCLDELLEILKCKEDIGQIVMTVFYGVDPSDVRKQTRDFGIAFNETCAHKTEEDRQRWSQALKDVGNIAGEDFFRWDNEANMIKKIARDVSNKLNATPSRDFDDMVGLESHLEEMESLLDLDNVGVKMVAITGPAGIGKTTIARALHNRLSNRFQLTCFVDNLRGTNPIGNDEYGLKLRLQEQFLSNILNLDGVTIRHSGVVEERLRDQSVLIVLDDVNNIKQLEALAGDISWFGPRSRIVVTTENQELLQQHGINDMYHVGFPSDVEAIEILRKYAFRQSYLHDGFEEIAGRIAELCGYLPLGLRVVGSSLLGKMVEEWETVMRRLETTLDRDIEDVLRVGYDSLDENEQSLFLHIAIFFNYKDCDLVKRMLEDGDLDVQNGLKILTNRSLIYISAYEDKEEIVMHTLLQQMARQAIQKQEPWKRQILLDADEICDVLENETGTRVVSGISFDISRIDEVSIGKKAFRRMSNLRFLRVYKSKDDGYKRIDIPEKMELPRRLRLLCWVAYPNKCLPPTFHPEYLVELDMQDSQLEYLWQGTQELTSLKEMNLEGCKNLKQLPDLSKATSLETLKLSYCESLVEIPSSCSHLKKLKTMWMKRCTSLEVVPAHLNLPSLEFVSIEGCPLGTISFLSTCTKEVHMPETAVEEVLSASVRPCSGCFGNLKGLTHLPTTLIELDLSYSDIDWIPDSIKALDQLSSLDLTGCKRLASLPELPCSLMILVADGCESLENVFRPLNSPFAMFYFTNCSKLGQEARKTIIQRRLSKTTPSLSPETLLPGRRVPEEFECRARGNSLTISLHGNNIVRLCVVVSSIHQTTELTEGFKYLVYRYTLNGDLDHLHSGERTITVEPRWRTDHLYIFEETIDIDCREMRLEFSSKNQDFDIIECGAHIWTDKTSEGSSKFESRESAEDDNEMCGHTNGVICVAEDYQVAKRMKFSSASISPGL